MACLPLKRGGRHFDDIFVTCSTESCYYDNLRYSQWRKCHQNNIFFVLLSMSIYFQNPYWHPAHLTTRNIFQNEILLGIQTFSFNKMHLKLSSAKCRPFCSGLVAFSDSTTSISGSMWGFRPTDPFLTCTYLNTMMWCKQVNSSAPGIPSEHM